MYGWWATLEATAVWWPLPVLPTPFLFLLGILAIIAFIAWERRRRRAGQSTMLPLELFSIPSFRNGNIVAMIVSLGELGLLFVLPLWLQNVLRDDALQTGLVLLALAAVLFVYGLGLGLASAQVTNVVLADVPVEQSGRASGTQSTSRQVGSALGIAVLGTLLFGSLSMHLTDALPTLDPAQRTQVVAAVTDSAGAAIPGLLADPTTAQIGQTAAEAFTSAASTSAFGAGIFLAIALIASFFLGRRARQGAERPADSSASPRTARE